ncbi:MAG: glycosyltransferase [Clostridia bacterium]
MRKKKKLLYIVEAMGGGVFTYIVELANKLAEEYDLYIAYAVRSQTPEDYKDYFDKRIHLIKVENFIRAIRPVNDIKAGFEIRKIVKDINPDIIHLHSAKAGILGRLFLNKRKHKFFYTPHGYSFLMEDCNPLKRNMYKGIEKVFGMAKCKTICCSVGEYNESLKVTKKSSFISNGIDINVLKKQMKDIQIEKHNKPIVFTIGRICEQKNPSMFNEIAKSMPNVDFVWIGDGELKEQLTSENIKITGWISREEVIKYAMQADIFILTSLWEGLPISLLESMYMKKVCIVSDVVGNRDVIINNHNGFVCKNTEHFIKRIQENVDNLNKEVAQKAYESIIDTYNTDMISVLYSKEYEN